MREKTNKGSKYMEKGAFAKYANKVYRVSNIVGDRIRLVSENQTDKNIGFKEKNLSF
jgi:hypothetical protein